MQFVHHMVTFQGEKVGVLEKSVAMKMNLCSSQSIPVAASLIDAHAGALGMLATRECVR